MISSRCNLIVLYIAKAGTETKVPTRCTSGHHDQCASLKYRHSVDNCSIVAEKHYFCSNIRVHLARLVIEQSTKTRPYSLTWGGCWQNAEKTTSQKGETRKSCFVLRPCNWYTGSDIIPSINWSIISQPCVQLRIDIIDLAFFFFELQAIVDGIWFHCWNNSWTLLWLRTVSVGDTRTLQRQGDRS